MRPQEWFAWKLDTLFSYFGRRLLEQLCSARRPKRVSRKSSNCWRDHVNTSRPIILCTDRVWANKKYVFYYRPTKSRCNNASPSNTNLSFLTNYSSHAKKHSHPCVLFVDAVTRICFELWFSVYAWFIARRWIVTLLSGTSSYFSVLRYYRRVLEEIIVTSM